MTTLDKTMKKFLFLFLLLLFGNAHCFAAGGGSSAPVSEYYSFDTPFVVNIMDDKRMRFLQVAIQMKLVDPTTAADVTLHQHAIRHNIIMLLSSQQAGELYSTTGKERLRHETLNEIKQALQKRAEHVEIEDIFFTSFIIQ